MNTQTVIIPPRFNGPPGVANGGIACGAIAGVLGGRIGGNIEVRLHRPVPLGRPLEVRRAEDGSVLVEDAGVLVARGHAVDDATDLAVPERVDAADADDATQRSSCLTAPVFPDCFVCGSGRPAGDGLRILPGRVGDRPVWAAPWTPHRFVADADGRIPPAIVWAALDCPSGFAAVEHALDSGAVPAGAIAVLGRMRARIAALPAMGVRHRVIAWPLGVDGRKLTAGSALVSPSGEVLAAARATWITVPAPVVAASGSLR